MRPPTARPRINEDELDPHAKPLGVAVTVLSEESTFEAGKKRFCGLTSPRSGETPAGPNAAGENRLCPQTRGQPAAKGRTVAGERQRVPQLPDRE